MSEGLATVDTRMLDNVATEASNPLSNNNDAKNNGAKEPLNPRGDDAKEAPNSNAEETTPRGDDTKEAPNSYAKEPLNPRGDDAKEAPNSNAEETTPRDNDTEETTPQDNDTEETTPQDNDTEETAPRDNDTEETTPRDNDTEETTPRDNDTKETQPSPQGFRPIYQCTHKTPIQELGALYRPLGLKPPQNNNFDVFFSKTIHLLKDQRNEGHQFAFLFVTKEDNIANVILHTSEKVVQTSNEATDSKVPSYPPNYLLGNYICARPDKSDPENVVHTETILLERLESLMVRHRGCRTIFLYTWLFPCPECAAKIIASLGSRGKYGKHRRVLVYTSAANYDTQLCWYKEQLASAGIEVRQTKGQIRL